MENGRNCGTLCVKSANGELLPGSVARDPGSAQPKSPIHQFGYNWHVENLVPSALSLVPLT